VYISTYIHTYDPCVGIVSVISSSASFFSTVVLPALSRPSTRMQNSFSVSVSLRSNVSNPILYTNHGPAHVVCACDCLAALSHQPDRYVQIPTVLVSDSD